MSVLSWRVRNSLISCSISFRIVIHAAGFIVTAGDCVLRSFLWVDVTWLKECSQSVRQFRLREHKIRINWLNQIRKTGKYDVRSFQLLWNIEHVYGRQDRSSLIDFFFIIWGARWRRSTSIIVRIRYFHHVITTCDLCGFFSVLDDSLLVQTVSFDEVANFCLFWNNRSVLD